MTDKECWDALKGMRAKAAGKKDGSEHKDRDIRALDHAICLLGEQIIDRERKHDDIPKPGINRCMTCGKIIYDDKAICDKCYEIAKKEGLLI